MSADGKVRLEMSKDAKVRLGMSKDSKVRLVTVSYTHLTLPTKLEV